MNQHPTFEETYPKYEFAELVRLGLVLGKSIVELLRPNEAPWPARVLHRAGPTRA